ncbi:MAG: Holliday junction resolvase RuvX [bacterium]
MSVDWGERRVGIALSDEGKVIASPHLVLSRSRILKDDFNKLADLIRKNDVELVIVGLPLNLDGSRGTAAEKVLEVVSLMQESLNAPVVIWDERLSTAEAERVLIGGDVSRKKRKTLIDRVAAAIFLQAFLDSRSGGKA